MKRCILMRTNNSYVWLNDVRTHVLMSSSNQEMLVWCFSNFTSNYYENWPLSCTIGIFTQAIYIYILLACKWQLYIYIYVFEVRNEGVIHFAVCKFIDYMSQVLGYVKYIRNHETGFHCTWSRLLHTEGFHLCQVVGLYYTYIDGADVEHIIIVSE